MSHSLLTTHEDLRDKRFSKFVQLLRKSIKGTSHTGI